MKVKCIKPSPGFSVGEIYTAEKLYYSMYRVIGDDGKEYNIPVEDGRPYGNFELKGEFDAIA